MNILLEGNITPSGAVIDVNSSNVLVDKFLDFIDPLMHERGGDNDESAVRTCLLIESID